MRSPTTLSGRTCSLDLSCRLGVEGAHHPPPDTFTIADQGNAMRFFNSGVEIAHDGSPVADILATSPQPVGNATTQMVSTSDPDLSTSDTGVIEAKGSTGGRGLPRFSKGVMIGYAQSVTTPSRPFRPWEGSTFQGAGDEDFLR